MVLPGSALLKKFQDKYKDVTFPPEAAETLQEVQRFLLANSVENANDATHEALADCWWSDSKRGGGNFLGISEDLKLDKLHRHIGNMFDLKVPLALGEKRSKHFQLIQEIQILGTQESSLDPELLVGPPSKFLEIIGQAMMELYPSVEPLELCVLDGSGTNHTRGVKETLIRLVWHDIVVDKNRALHIRDFVLAKLRAADCEEVRDLQRRATEISKAESWKACFKEDIYHRQDVIRMIYNDNVPGPNMPRLEGRPLQPKYVYLFEQKDGKVEATWEAASNLPWTCEDWAKRTSIRRSSGVEMTKWAQPKDYVAKDPSQPHKPRVAIRGGPSTDDHYKDRKKAVSGEVEQPTQTIDRLFPRGTLQDFVANMKRAMGEDLGKFSVNEREKKVVWTYESGATVEYRETNGIVRFMGEAGLIRHFLSSASEFLQPVPQGWTGKEVSSCAFTNGYSGGPTQPRVVEPSQGPTRPTSLAAVSVPKTPTIQSAAGCQTKKVPYKRIVVEDYKKCCQGEVSLTKGDIVTVTHDPDAETGNFERLVFGAVDATGESGWFDLADTRSLD